MNLEDVLAPECGLQQDDYSLSGVVFGDEGQLKVIGWSGKHDSSIYIKYYILKCNKCSQDAELFGEGVFRSLKGSLLKGASPCGCRSTKRYSPESKYIYTCSVCSTPFKSDRYRKLHICSKVCRQAVVAEKRGTLTLKAQSKKWPKKFISEGKFHPDTKFKILGLGNKFTTPTGSGSVWEYFCPDCQQVGVSRTSSLLRGKRSCACSVQRQQECYISWIVDGDSKVAIKFGIARDSKQRVKQQNTKSIYEVQQYQVYKFPDVASCKKAERECKKELDCGIILKRDMPDGYSETTWIYNLSKIQDIYKRNGGELV